MGGWPGRSVLALWVGVVSGVSVSSLYLICYYGLG